MLGQIIHKSIKIHVNWRKENINPFRLKSQWGVFSEKPIFFRFSVPKKINGIKRFFKTQFLNFPYAKHNNNQRLIIAYSN
jgi:hypothetical protein